LTKKKVIFILAMEQKAGGSEEWVGGRRQKTECLRERDDKHQATDNGQRTINK
jgi:hypothetical protein